MPHKTRVLFLCTGNSARSQMTEGLLRTDGGGDYAVSSAGTHPRPVRAEAILAMDEVGIDIRQQRSKSVEEFSGQEFDYVITVCAQAQQTCPILGGTALRLHWNVADTAGVDDFRAARDQLRAHIHDFLCQNRG